ncbi:MAG: H-NS histone family protein [Rubrivivax sp.]|nr:H-NS histone family protein [Rubrivivax sp.]
MARTYSDIQEQIAKLQARAESLKAKELGSVIARIKSAIAAYGLTAADLGLERGRPAKATGRVVQGARKRTAKPRKVGKVPVKYRDKLGNTWTGRGLHPIWLREALAKGAKLESFLV